MTHEFIVLIDGKLVTYQHLEDIPEKIDNVISFKPELPPGPHTEHEHDEIDEWNDKLLELMKRETNGR